MVESYKYKSKIATAIAFIAGFIAYVGKDGLNQIVPKEYSFIIPILIFGATYILTQSTENKRVEVAEELIHEQYQNDDDPTIPEDEIITYDDDEVVGDDGA